MYRSRIFYLDDDDHQHSNCLHEYYLWLQYFIVVIANMVACWRLGLDTNSYSSGSSFRHETPTLRAIRDKFKELLTLRDRAFAQRQSLPGHDKWVLAEAELSKTAIDPICDELHALAWTAAKIPATNAPDRRYKAEILREHIEDQQDDLVSALSDSLAADCIRGYRS